MGANNLTIRSLIIRLKNANTWADTAKHGMAQCLCRRTISIKMRCQIGNNLDSKIHGPHSVDAAGGREHRCDVSVATISIHAGAGDGSVGEVGDDGSATGNHGIGGALGLHHACTLADGTALLKLFLGDLALGEETENLTDGGLG